MAQPELSVPVPLRRLEDGSIRVGNTRVSLDRVIAAFQTGATPEEIAQDYSVLRLADIYAVIAYYLQHQAEVDSYLEERRARAAEFRRELEARWPNGDLRARLLSRQQQ
jgi:uncharacterized protein (DUF433 family)